MNWKKFMCTALAFPILYAGVSSSKSLIANAEDFSKLPTIISSESSFGDSIENRVIEASDKCPIKNKNEYFYFDELQITPFEKVSLDGKLRDFALKRPSFRVMSFDIKEALQFPTRLFGVCDWWSNNLEWTFGMGNEAYVRGSDQTMQLIWNLQSGLRWYSNKDRFFEFGWQHHSFGGTSKKDAEEYLVKNNIDVEDVQVRDISFLRFADKFEQDNISIEYFIARGFWEAQFGDTFSALFHLEKRQPYNSTAWGFKTSVPFNNLLDFSTEGEGEFSSRNNSQTLRLSFDTPDKEGASVFYEVTRGIGKNKVETGFHGLKTDGHAYGIKLFYKH